MPIMSENIFQKLKKKYYKNVYYKCFDFKRLYFIANCIRMQLDKWIIMHAFLVK